MKNVIQCERLWAASYEDGEDDVIVDPVELEVADDEIIVLKGTLSMNTKSLDVIPSTLVVNPGGKDIYRELTCWEGEELDRERVASELLLFNFDVEGVQYMLWCTRYDIKSIYPWIEQLHTGEPVAAGTEPGACEFIVTRMVDVGPGKSEVIGLTEKERASIFNTTKADYIPLIIKAMQFV